MPEPQPRRPAAPRSSHNPTQNGSDDDWVWVIVLGFAVVFGVAAVTWAAATAWTPVSISLRALVVVSLFITGLTWRRWPVGLRGANGLRGVIVMVGACVLWAVVALSKPARTEPSLRDIERVTRGMGWSDAVSTTVDQLGMSGILTYELRFAGMALLLVNLVLLSARAAGAVVVESAARSQNPRPGVIRIGNRLLGPWSMGYGCFAGVVVMAVLGVVLVHPWSVGLFLDWAESQQTLPQ